MNKLEYYCSYLFPFLALDIQYHKSPVDDIKENGIAIQDHGIAIQDPPPHTSNKQIFKNENNKK